MICSLNILFNHPVSEATPNSKITGAYSGTYIYSKQCIRIRIIIIQLGLPVARLLTNDD
jgi:hypothetical protein